MEIGRRFVEPKDLEDWTKFKACAFHRAKLVITSARTLWCVRKTYRQLKSFKDSEGSKEPKEVGVLSSAI